MSNAEGASRATMPVGEAAAMTGRTATAAVAGHPAPPASEVPEEESAGRRGGQALIAYLLLGIAFGFVLVRSEVISWFRIQEMFRFQGFHMYGIFIGALAVAVPSVAWIKRRHAHTLSGESIRVPPKEMGRGYRYWIGGGCFGVGWALTGTCPGPMFALVGAGVTVMIVTLLSALAGTWVYGWLRPRLPHY